MSRRLPDRSDGERRARLRRPRFRFERGIRVESRACDAKRWAWQTRIWREYGLTAWDVALMWRGQRGLCPLCEAPLETKVWVIEHRHVEGFAKLTPDEKRAHFRGITCGWCNHRVLSMIERAGPLRVRNALMYLGC